MTTSTMTRAMTVGAALVLAASGVLGGDVADAGVADAGDGTTCAPTTRTLDTLTYSTPLALSPRGHVVAEEGDPGAIPALWLHRPNGTKTAITYSNGYSPYGVSDVNGNESAVGTSGVNVGAIAAGVPWISHSATASLLPAPTRPNMPSYFATSVNGRGVVAGVATNYPFSSPGKTDFLAAPIVWPDAATNPVDLPMPTGVYAVAFDRGQPLISIRRDGSVSAVLEDYNSVGTYLARWATVTSAPTLVTIPDGLTPTSVAGRWVVGEVGGDMFVFTPSEAVMISTPTVLFLMSVTTNGTYIAKTDAGSWIIGRGTAPPRDAVQYGALADVAGSRGGQVAIDGSPTTAVLTCALGLPEATNVDVTPIVLG